MPAIGLLGLALATVLQTAQAAPGFIRATEVDPAIALRASPPTVPADWVQIEQVFTRLHADRADRRTAQRLSDHAEKAVPRLSEALGVPAGRTIEVYLTPDQDSFRALQPGKIPRWADGTAWPQRGLIFLRAPRVRDGTASPLEQVFDHEIVHILLGRAFAPRPVPRWLQEGTAQILAREYTAQTTGQLANGVLGGSLMSLDDLTSGFPASPTRAALAYAQSADLVAFILNNHGEDALRVIVSELARGQSFDGAIRAATGGTVIDLETTWRGRLASSGLWLKPLVADSTLLGVTGLGLVFFWARARRQRRETLARWEVEERERDELYAVLGGSSLSSPPSR